MRKLKPIRAFLFAAFMTESYALRAFGVALNWQSKVCNAGRFPNLKRRIEMFANYMEYDPYDPANKTVGVNLYSDDTCTKSGVVEISPLWLSLSLMSVETRTNLKQRGHCLMALLPNDKTVHYRFASGKDAEGSLQLTSAMKLEALTALRLQAFETILKDWKSHEVEGKLYGNIRLRVMLFQYSCDMKERLLLTGLTSYKCFNCYEFNGKEYQYNITGKRTAMRDKTFRQELLDDIKLNPHDKAGAEKAFLQTYSCCGLSCYDTSPFTRNPLCAIYTLEGICETMRSDALHQKDGVINYYTGFVSHFIGPDLLKESTRFGNVHLKTNKYSMHYAEKTIESLHSFPVAIAFGKFNDDISEDEREKLFIGCCDLLRILGLLTDPCPAFILPQLRATIRKFRDHVNWLLGMLELRGIDGAGTNETPKLHELFAHMADHIEEAGLSDSFSTKFLETLHELLTLMMRETSQRDDSACLEMMNRSFFISVVEEVEIMRKGTSVYSAELSDLWESEAIYKIAKLIGQPTTPNELLKMNVQSVAELLLGRIPKSILDNLPILQEENGLEFGNSLHMYVNCKKRQRIIIRTSKAVVPGTSQGEFKYALSAIAFKNYNYNNSNRLAVPVGKEECDDPNCRRFRTFLLII